MIIKSKNADFSAVGLGTAVFEVSQEVENLLLGFDGLDLSYKLKFQKFINDIGGISGDIWNTITMLYVPYFANTVNEAYYDIKMGTLRVPGGGEPHMAGCAPNRGEGATYDLGTYPNALNYANLTPSNSGRFFGTCRKITSYTKANMENYMYGGAGYLGCFQKESNMEYIRRITGVNINLAGHNIYFSKQISVVGNHAMLTGLSNDSPMTRDSIVGIIDNCVADSSSLPSGTYTSDNLSWYALTGYNFSNLNANYQTQVYSMLLAGGALSKQNLLKLNAAMYNFCKNI